MKRFPPPLHAVAILVLCMAGCTSTTTLTKPITSTSLIDFTIALRAETSAGLDRAVVAIPLTDVSDRISPDTKLSALDHQLVKRLTYSAIATWWCPRHKEVSSTEQVSQKFGEACRARGGIWHRPYCEDAEGSPLFLAAILPNRYCSSGFVTAAVYIVEPTSSINDSEYLRALRASGVPTRSEQETQVRNRQQHDLLERDRVPAHSNGANWYMVTRNIAGTFSFFDAETVQRTKSSITVLIRTFQHSEPNSDGSWATATRMRFNCSERTVQSLEMTMYDLNDSVIAHQRIAQPALAVVSGSTGDDWMRMTCSSGFPQALIGPGYLKLPDNDILGGVRRLRETRNQ